MLIFLLIFEYITIELYYKYLWLDPVDYISDFAWDNTLLTTNTYSSNISEIRKLIAKAYKVQLNISQQKQLENALSKDSSLILHADLTPSKVIHFYLIYKLEIIYNE